MGHEVVGEIVEVGKGIKKFKLGDRVFAPFCTSCGMSDFHRQLVIPTLRLVAVGSCKNCQAGWTARCELGAVPGQPKLAGAQAEFFRSPLADSSLFPMPTDIPEEIMLLMSDILPTGYSVAVNARMLMEVPPVPSLLKSSGLDSLAEGKMEKKGVCVVIGCGPVSR